MYKTLLILLLSFNSFALDCNKLSHTSTLNGGRVKVLLATARSTIKTLTNKYSYNGQSALKVFCMLNNSGDKHSIEIPIEHPKLKEFFKISTSKIDINKAIEQQELIRIQIIKEKEKTSYKKALNKLWFRMQVYTDLTSGILWKLPIDTGNKFSWHSYADIIKDDSTTKILDLDKKYKEKSDTSFLKEIMLIKTKPFTYAMLLALIAIFFLVLKKQKAAIAISLITVLIQIYGIVLRVMVSGRAPITNMYETVMFSGLGALIIALSIYIFKKENIYIIGGLAYNILCLFMMKFSFGMLNEDISPLVPVLRDNFWLSTHVTTIILSYAALALSWIVACITLFKQRFQKISAKQYRYNEKLIYTCVKIGIVLLSAGIILGGIWADYSWGRFWGWDPKETWSLIVLLFYMVLLHAKGTNWINTHRFVIACAAGFMSVMMAWFGVNYILAAGLHSYGFSEGGAIFLGSFFTIQIIFLITCAKNKTQIN
ncbi:MAG: cytochrome c biogenesis protein CcsA [Bacteriovoracaceae bacterium]|jgi:cytochrome c-type biogenesis protein CcsB|nr:cytochrome c biogenesis protein CcsA [Bacteriovoracaceae bacterium]